jgi:hypothetical protein
MAAKKKRPTPEERYFSCEEAEELWYLVHEETRFNRRVVKGGASGGRSNKRLLYLFVVAVLRRVEHLAKQPAWRKLLQVTEAYAEGKARLSRLHDAHDEAECIPTRGLTAAEAAAVFSVGFLTDEYKVIRGLDHVSDAAGYLAAIEAGVLAKDVTFTKGRRVWKKPAFLAGKKQEERAICAVLRDVVGNPFRPPVIDPACLAWNGRTIPKTAQAIYDDQRFDDLPVLADALEEADCYDEDILGHCRGPGPHVRGCWVVDLMLGKG